MKISLSVVAACLMLAGCGQTRTEGQAANDARAGAADSASLKTALFADPAAADMDRRIDRYLDALAREAKDRSKGENRVETATVPTAGTTWTVSSGMRDSYGCGDPPGPDCGRDREHTYRVVASGPNEVMLAKGQDRPASPGEPAGRETTVTERWSPFGTFGEGGPRGIPFLGLFPLEPGKFETVRWTEPVPPAAEATIRRSCIVLGFAPVAVLGSSRAAVQVTCLRRAVAPIVYGARTILVTDLDYLPDLGIVGRERFEGKYASFVDGKTEIMSTWEQSETKSFSGP